MNIIDIDIDFPNGPEGKRRTKAPKPSDGKTEPTQTAIAANPETTPGKGSSYSSQPTGKAAADESGEGDVDIDTDGSESTQKSRSKTTKEPKDKRTQDPESQKTKKTKAERKREKKSETTEESDEDIDFQEEETNVEDIEEPTPPATLGS